MNIQDYKAKISALKRKIGNIQHQIEYLECSYILDKLRLLKKQIDEEQFRLIVVGEFSRGKSTFVNAILGKKILPSSMNPTTAILNIIENGDGEEYVFEYYDGKQEEISKEQFLKTVAKDISSVDRKETEQYVNYLAQINRIKAARIKVKNELGENGIEIIDTPGVNDLNERREQITYDYIPNADAAIVVCAADQQMTVSEMNFIQKKILGNDISKVFIVINFKDKLHSENDQQRVYNLFVERCKGFVPKSRIFMVSSKEALNFKRKQHGENIKNSIYLPESLENTGFVELEEALSLFLASERGNIKIERFEAMLKAIILDVVKNVIPYSKKAAMMEKEQLVMAIKELKPQIERNKRRCYNELEDASQQLLLQKEKIIYEYRKELERLAFAAKHAVEDYMGDSPDELDEILSECITPFEKRLRVDIPKSNQTMMMEIIESAMGHIGDDFTSLGISLPELTTDAHDTKIMVNRQDLIDSPEKSSEDDILGALVVGAIGVIAVVAIASSIPLAAPFIHAGAGALKALGNKGQKRNKELDEVSNDKQSVPVVTNAMIKRVYQAEVRKRFFDSIDTQTKNYSIHYDQCINKAIEVLKNECEQQLNQTIEQLEQKIQEKRERTCSIQEEFQRIENMERNLLYQIAGVNEYE